MFCLKISLEIGMAAGRGREARIEPVPFFLPEMRIFGAENRERRQAGMRDLRKAQGGGPPSMGREMWK